MKRFHVHVGVSNMDESIAFYSRLFGQAPSKQEKDYAKWMLEDPRINFALSPNPAKPGINHVGFQVDSREELATLKQQAQDADAVGVLDEGQTTCCYANSEKHWTVDPQGVAWEHFHTMGEAKEYGNNGPAAILEGGRDHKGCCSA